MRDSGRDRLRRACPMALSLAVATQPGSTGLRRVRGIRPAVYGGSTKRQRTVWSPVSNGAFRHGFSPCLRRRPRSPGRKRRSSEKPRRTGLKEELIDYIRGPVVNDGPKTAARKRTVNGPHFQG
jgi:hypothetical protein